MSLKIKKHILKWAAIVMIAAYFFGPVIAAALRYSDRRGPKVYPEVYHEIIFIIAHEAFHDGEKPRLRFPVEPRRWFY